MYEDSLTDESIGWPSYVDFLASFAFLLILFVTWSISLIANVEHQRALQEALGRTRSGFIQAGFEAVIEGQAVRIPLRNKVEFGLNETQLNESSKAHLRNAGRKIAESTGVRRIIVMGYADNVKAPGDEFFNWKVSVDRAEAVLKFLYLCTDCGYRAEDIRPKLVLHGDGDLASRHLAATEQRIGNGGDRRVDIVLDQSDDNGSQPR